MNINNMEDVVHAHTVALAHTVADIATNSDQPAEDLGKAFADFATSLADEAEKAARRRRRRKPTPEDGDDTVPPEKQPGTTADIRETTKGISMKDNFMKAAKNIADAGGAGETTQQEFLELGRQIYGKAEFNKVLVHDRDIQAAVSTLHKRDIKRWAAKAYGVVPQAEVNVAAEIAKMRDRGGAPKTWPHVEQKPNVSQSIEGVPDDIEAMVARELKSAPWLTTEQAWRRVEAARQAATRRSKAQTPRQLV
jgi:hypothetical protein